MIERLIDSEHSRKKLVELVKEHKLPFTAKLEPGRMRSIEQNRLQWLWASEAAQHRQDSTAREIQMEWKLNFGVPILCVENEEFAAAWLMAEAKLSYSDRMNFMLCLPVTSIMTSRQLSEYLDQVYRHNAEHGIRLTDPEDLRWEHAEEGQGVDREHA